MEEIFGHLLSGGSGAILVLVVMWERVRRLQRDLESIQNRVSAFEKFEESIAKVELNQEHTNEKLTDIKNDIKELYNLIKK